MKIIEAPDLKEKEITSPKTSHSSEDRTLIDGSPKVAVAVEVEVVVDVNEEKEREREDGWWKKVVDLEEIKKQVLYALPMIITNVSYYLIPVVALMFAGHLGDLELAGSNLAHSWATVTGYAFMIGESGALETLCGQGYGAKLYRMMGIYLQASCLISLLCSVFISISWLFLESILILLHQDLQVSKAAALYMRYLIPGLFAFGFLQNMVRFLQTQSVVVPLVFCSVLSLVAHIGITYVLVHLTPLGFKGSALAVSISLWIAVVMLAGYVRISKKLKHTWNGFLVVESLNQVFITLRLALPSAAMVCLEYSAFELLIFLAGLMPNPVITTPLIAMCVNTGAIAYMITYSLSAAASTRVSNELGAGNPDRARHAFRVSVMLSLFLGLIVVSALACGHKIWAGFFSDSSTIIKKFASLSHFLTISIILDSIQGVLSGVARGCGWQHLAVYINLGTFYCIGTPISIFLGFKRKLYAEGLRLGLVCGLSCQAISLLLLTQCSKWKRIELSVNTIKESHELPNSALSNEDSPAHLEHEAFFNKKIEMYDEIALVVGKDMATGQFAKSFDDIEEETVAESNSIDFGVAEVSKGKCTASSNEAPTQARPLRKRSRDEDEGYDKLSAQIGEVALAIKKLSDDRHDVKDLYAEVMKPEGFDEFTLASAFDHLVENEKVAKAFMVKSATLRRAWLEGFFNMNA